MRITRRRTRPPHPGRTNREGYMAFVVVGALLVVLGVAAVAVDRMWIDNASVELQSSADAAALAAARTLAGDGTLAEDVDWTRLVDDARTDALRATELNPVAGGKLVLRPGPEGDVWFGRNVLDRETGQTRFVHSDYQPFVVKVRAERTEDTANSVGMLLGGLFGVPRANVSTYSTVVLDNHVLGIRPRDGIDVPALPLAIRGLGDDSSDDEDTDTEGGDDTDDDVNADDDPLANWVEAIENRGGRDEWSWDTERKEAVRRSDGLPEMVLRPRSLVRPRANEETEEPNVHLVDLGSGLRFGHLERQINRGLNGDDLRPFGGELLLDGRHHRVDGTSAIDERVLDMFEEAIGKPRLAFLYENHEPGRDGRGTLDLVRLVGVRLLAVRRTGERVELVVQPCVVATKTAIPFEDWQWYASPRGESHATNTADGANPAFRNRYVYQLTVTP